MPIALGEGAPRRRAHLHASREAIREDWRLFKDVESLAARNRLIAHYMPTLVRPIARQVHARLPQQVDVEDLAQEGYLGLVKAMSRFDPHRATIFEGFARLRVIGSIRDFLRSLDLMPRLSRSRWKQILAAREAFGKKHGRPPTDDEVYALIDIPDAVASSLLSGPPAAALVSFSSVQSEASNGAIGEADAMDTFEARGPAPAAAANRADLQRWLTRGFDDRDRLIIVLYYYERLTMRDIGRAVGISESRVSQRLVEIVERLRARLTGMREVMLDLARE